MELNRLMLCSGRMRRTGWKTLDANPQHEPDFLAMIPPLPDAVKAISWNEIEWIHGITSFYPWDGEALLGELYEVLASGGKLVMEQPNPRLIAVGEYPQWVFGDPSLRDPLHMNKWAWNMTDLALALKSKGFHRVEMHLAQYHVPERDFRVEAYK